MVAVSLFRSLTNSHRGLREAFEEPSWEGYGVDIVLIIIGRGPPLQNRTANAVDSAARSIRWNVDQFETFLPCRIGETIVKRDEIEG